MSATTGSCATRPAGSPPSTSQAPRGTGPYRINDRGQLVGRYSQTHANIQDPNAIQRGFLLDHGKLTRIDVPGAAETQVVGLNNRGQVVGEYRQPAGVFHGFLWHKGRFDR
jgi:uncharacterized membrane protein